MTRKDWIKDKREKDRWLNVNNNHSLEIDKFGNEYFITIRDEYVYIQNQYSFKNKLQAMKFAEKYMREN